MTWGMVEEENLQSVCNNVMQHSGGILSLALE